MNFVQKINPFTDVRRFVLLCLGLLVVVSAVVSWQSQVSAVRFKDRSLIINSAVISATTTYTVNFSFPTTNSVGSVQMEFCSDPIPTEPCSTIPGLDVSAATLASQAGETGFSVTQQTANKLVLARTPSVTGLQNNTYVLSGAKNPSGPYVFYIRLTSYASSNASGNFIDYGGVASTASRNLNLQTQVAPELIFCVSMIIPNMTCSTLLGGNYIDFGELRDDETYATQSQFMVRTNAPNGYAISVDGIGVTSGNKTIDSLDDPTLSAAGNSQFGINLTVNANPGIGADQIGIGVPGTINPDYLHPDEFLYRPGDTLVTATSVTDFVRYTTSYILNRPADQAPGVYATTLTYICTGMF